MKTIWVLQGPNLNLLGTREPEIYGRATLGEIEHALVEHGTRLGVEVACFQSNHEGDLITKVQEARGRAHGLIVNFAAFSHTSIALRDALAFTELPAVEVHLSNVHRREAFRHSLVTAGACVGSIVGLGARGYHLALDFLVEKLGSSETPR